MSVNGEESVSSEKTQTSGTDDVTGVRSTESQQTQMRRQKTGKIKASETCHGVPPKACFLFVILCSCRLINEWRSEERIICDLHSTGPLHVFSKALFFRGKLLEVFIWSPS